MSIDLCVTKTAEHPFLISQIGIRIYSIEELCWFLDHNLYLVDESITSKELMVWIRDELEMKQLARKLSEALDRPDSDASYFIIPIFASIGYLSAQELRRVREELTKVQVQPEEEKAKTRADYLAKGGRCQAAIMEYRHILDNRNAGKLGASFYASVWNNLGCAYAKLFRFSDAADAFLNGFKTMQSRELMRKYVSTLPLYLSDEEYIRKLEEIGADRLLIGKIQEYNLNLAKEVSGKVASRRNLSENPDEVLRRMKEEYRRGAAV